MSPFWSVFLILIQVYVTSISSKGLDSKYSAVIVFGDSYSDDEHRRSEPILNPYAALATIGKKSTGILWPNIIVKEMCPASPPKLYDYSYNGAHSNNKLTNMTLEIPDTRAQIKEYLSDLKSGNIESGQGRILYIWWVGINPIDAIWADACEASTTQTKTARYPDDPIFLHASERVGKQIEEVRYQVENLRANVAANTTPASYMVITVPNIDRAPLQKSYVEKLVKGDEGKEKKMLKLLQLLIDQYNKGIQKAIHTIRVAYGESKGFIRTYDIAPLWNMILDSPQKYGIKNVTGSCLVNNVVCANVSEYFFWDYLHPSPLVESIFSQAMNKFVLAQI